VLCRQVRLVEQIGGARPFAEDSITFRILRGRVAQQSDVGKLNLTASSSLALSPPQWPYHQHMNTQPPSPSGLPSLALALHNVPTLQALELRSLSPEIHHLSELTPGLPLRALSNDTLVVLACTYPIAKAIARVIVRDKLKLTFTKKLADGTLEEGTLEARRVGKGDDDLETEIIEKLISQVVDKEH
jgi:hypothetical protein